MSNGASRVNGMGLTWQQKLQDHCRLARLPEPVFNIMSDRRGGRTAWSSSVSIPGITTEGHEFTARHFYDGKYIDNAKEDAAEVALEKLNSLPRTAIIFPG